jgi:hypothetical protein
VADYQALIDGVVAKLNRLHHVKIEEEQAYLQSLPKYRLPDYEVLSVKVSRRSTTAVAYGGKPSCSAASSVCDGFFTRYRLG